MFPLFTSIREPNLRTRSGPGPSDLDGLLRESGVPWIRMLHGLVVSFGKTVSDPTAHKSDRALMSIKEIIPHNSSLQCRYDLPASRLEDLRSCTG